MKQLFNLKSKFWENVKLTLKTGLVVLPILGFVYVMYLDLTTLRPHEKMIKAKQQQEQVIKINTNSAQV